MDQRMFDPASGQVIPQSTDAPRVREPLTSAPYQPDDRDPDPYVGFSGPTSVLGVYDPRDSSRPGVDPDSDADIGGLSHGDHVPKGDQGIELVDGVGEGPSGIISELVPMHDDLPGTELPATSPINEQVPPWQDPPKPQTTSTTSVWPGRTVHIGVNTPWPGSQKAE